MQLFHFKQSDQFFDNTCPSTKLHARSSNEYMSLYSSCNISNSYPSDVGPNDLGFTCALSKASFLSKLPMSVLILDSTRPCLERKIHRQTFSPKYDRIKDHHKIFAAIDFSLTDAEFNEISYYQADVQNWN